MSPRALRLARTAAFIGLALCGYAARASSARLAVAGFLLFFLGVSVLFGDRVR